MKYLKEKIEVVHEKDIYKLLLEFDILEDFKNRRILCKFCSKPLEIEDICAFFLKDNKLELVCNDNLCYEKLIQIKKLSDDNV